MALQETSAHQCCGHHTIFNFSTDKSYLNEELKRLDAAEASGFYFYTIILADYQRSFYEEILLERGWIILIDNLPNPIHTGTTKLTMFGFFKTKRYGELKDYIPDYPKVLASQPSLIKRTLKKIKAA